MIEAGFSDESNYLDYLMDEADLIYERQKEQESNEEDDLLDEDEYRALALKKDRRRKEQTEYEKQQNQKRIEYELILKQWAKEHPQKAKIWHAYYTGSSANDHESFFEDLGDGSKLSSMGYWDWIRWLEKYEAYEEFKTVAPQEWKKWKSSIYVSDILTQLLGYNSDKDLSEHTWTKGGTIKMYKILNQWIKENKHIWQTIVSEYNSDIKSDDAYMFQAWLETFYWCDSFTAWVTKYPARWEKLQSQWNELSNEEYKIIKQAWLKEHETIWKQWKTKKSDKWNKLKQSHYDLLWYVYTENEWNLQQETECNAFFYSDPRDFIPDNVKIKGDEFIHSYLIAQYKSKLRNNPQKEQFINKSCFIFEFESQLGMSWSGEESPEHYADRILLDLWIKAHRAQWEKWKYKYLCNNFKNTIYGFSDKDYFEIWKKLYATKWENWLLKHFETWKHKAISVNLWVNWIIFDGNESIFATWAEGHIQNWEELKSSIMVSDLRNACYTIFHDSNKFEILQNGDPAIWTYWKNEIEEEVFRNKFNNYALELPYTPRYTINIRINELRYKHLIGNNILHNNLAVIEKDGMYGYINQDWQMAIPFRFWYAEDFKNGFAAVKNKNSRWGIIDTNGNYVIQPKYDNLFIDENKLILFKISGSWQKITNFDGDIFYDWIGGKAGIMNICGDEIKPAIYDGLSFVGNGLIRGKIQENWGLLTNKGNELTQFKYTYIFNSTNDLMIANNGGIIEDGYLIGGLWGYLDINGQEVSPFIDAYDKDDFIAQYNKQSY